MGPSQLQPPENFAADAILYRELEWSVLSLPGP
jgi:hypothetical protein